MIIGSVLIVLAAVVFGVRRPGIFAAFIGLDLAMFGWQKLFHQQFVVPLGRLDEPFNSFSGEDLTWAYYHASYAFTCVIGSPPSFSRATERHGIVFPVPMRHQWRWLSFCRWS